MKLVASDWMNAITSAALLAVSLGSAACSASATAPRAPSGAAAPAACHVTGAPRVLARRVFVPRGVDVREQDGGFAVRFAAASSRCVVVDWPSGAQDPASVACSAPGARTAARTTSADETMLAWESHDGEEPHITLGIVAYDAPRAFFGVGIAGNRHVVERTFQAPGAEGPGGETAPELASIGHDRFLLAWVDGDVESHQLRAQSVIGWGDPLGPAMLLSPEEASVIGRPSVVVTPAGDGLVTYIASIYDEFDVLATPIACARSGGVTGGRRAAPGCAVLLDASACSRSPTKRGTATGRPCPSRGTEPAARAYYRPAMTSNPHLLDDSDIAALLQSGIRNDAFAGRLAAAGIDVVQDRCLMVEHRRARSGPL
jgi:CoA binding domain